MNESRPTNRNGAGDVLALARQRLASDPHFQQHRGTVGIERVNGYLILKGQLPSFYLKQLAQEALRGLHIQVVNRIDVVSCRGLSSVPTNTIPGASSPPEAR